MTVISVIIGSTRQGRFAEKPAHWILEHLKKRPALEVRLLDLKDFAMPFFEAPMPPATPGRPPFEDDTVRRWTAAVAQSDGFIFVVPEYNSGMPAVLKNAIDWVYQEWNRKAAAVVSYGAVMGASSAGQLRQTLVVPQVAVVPKSVKIPPALLWAHFRGDDVSAGLAQVDGQAAEMIDDLLWWTDALKNARANLPRARAA
jgi:NAD(P)H-dependent FMN reductase